MTLKTKFGIVFVLSLAFTASLTLAAFLFRACTRPVIPALPKDETERITVDPKHHTLTVTTPHGTTRTFLPDAPTTLDVTPRGVVVIHSPQYGFERRPFIGIGYASRPLVMAGVDVFYFKRFDVSPFLSLDTEKRLRGGVGVSYTVVSNLRGTVGFDTSKQFNFALTLRF